MKPLASLGAIGALCALLLAGTHRLTADDIRANRDAHAWRVAFDLVGAEFPTAGLHWDGDRLDLPDGVRLLRSSINGYAGEIEFIAAFRPGRNGANSLAGVRVTGHRETPGLGDFIDTARSPWIHRFSGRQPEEVDAVTGATITSEAVKRGVSALLRSMAEPVRSGNSGFRRLRRRGNAPIGATTTRYAGHAGNIGPGDRRPGQIGSGSPRNRSPDGVGSPGNRVAGRSGA